MVEKMKQESGVTYRSILEGRAPHMLYWQLDHLNPRRLPRPVDFHVEAGRRVFGAGDSRNTAIKPFASRSEPWLIADYTGVNYSHVREDNADVFRWETPLGTLTARRKSNHMTEFPVKTPDDVAIWQYVQERLTYRRNPEFTQRQGRTRWNVLWKFSPVQEMLQFVTRVESFYYLTADIPRTMKTLLDTMHRNNLEALAIGFRACPEATVLRLTENTSSQLISPSFYREYTLPHVSAYVDSAHRRGMKCIVHMCGSLGGLLDCFAETGMDGIHAVTPPPIGDTHYMAVRERFGPEFVIVGRLNAQLFVGRAREAILKSLKDMIPEELVRTPFALWITTDEMQPSETDVRSLVDALSELGE